jgi:xylose isomerase
VHLNGQKIGRFDQDLSLAADDIKDIFFVVKLLKDYRYKGTVAFDAHPYRSENDPWDFVERCMRTYKILAEKVMRLQGDAEYRRLMASLRRRKGALGAALGEYTPRRAALVRGHAYRPDRMALRELPYERIDQIATEVLLGVR